MIAIAMLLSACARSAAPGPAPAVDAGAAYDPMAVARAEDLRRAQDVGDELRASHDVTARRRAARALARIADGASVDALMKMLEDEDEETAAWAAYGLGYACKGREEAHVRALAARSASLGSGAPSSERGAVDARTALARAVGRCGGALAEQVLASWVRARGAWAPLAVYALGDLVARRNGMTEATAAALLDAAQGSAESPPLDAALYPFGRIDRAPDAFAPRVIALARGALARRSPTRIFAVRALGRSGREAIADLARAVEDRQLTPAERAEAARALSQLGEPGRAAAAEALARVTPDAKDALAIMALGGDEFGPLSALIAAAGADVPKDAEPALFTLASLVAPGGGPAIPPSLARRLAEIRCGAAGALSRGAYDSEVLKKCDAEGTEPAQRARLAALLRRPLNGERRALWRALTRSDHVRVREAALEAIAQHAELGDAARGALAEALATKKGGIVATAADVIHAHPDRVLVLAESEKRAALDPSAPPPSETPARAIDPAVAAALKAAVDKPWPEDLVETRSSLLDAAVAVGLPGARETALAACRDRNATMRERATRALRALGDAAPACPAPPHAADAAAAPEIGHELAHPTRVIFQTDAGELAIVFEPELAPVAATRFVGLARAGFYKGIVVHRVVPGFVAQFGDPDGDGFGGSGQLLRCETSPVPFGPLDVGVALAGRDTGSSQLFVTLARYPHLDGEYARVGRAEGDWAALAEGDAIREVKVDE